MNKAKPVVFADIKVEAHRMANLAKWAYEDAKEAKKLFKTEGLTGHKFFEKNGAQAHVAWNKDEVVLAFRGTEPSEFNDLKADLNIWPDKAQIGGWVHNGFQNEVNELWDAIIAFVNKSHRDKKTSVCGHSLGAAMATIAASRMHLQGKQLTLYTFGSPRVGNKKFVDSIVHVPHYRFVNNNDLVTTVPMWFMGYRHHGTVMYFNYNGIFKNLAWWRKMKDKFRGKWTALRKGQPFDGLYDHSMENYTKYTKDNK